VAWLQAITQLVLSRGVWGVGDEWPFEIAGFVRLGIVPEYKHVINYDHATKNCKNFAPNIHHKDHNLP